MAISLKLSVNGAPVAVSVEPHALLVQLLHERLRLTGTHVGCDTAQCGACTVHMNGWAVKPYNILAVQANGVEATTIEGLSKGGVLHPMQEALCQCHGLQCGFCTSGMVMAATALVAQHPYPDEHAVRGQLDSSLCCCMGYRNIVRAVIYGAEAMAEAQGDGASLQSLAATRAHAA